jgi:hypothetical protein
LSYKILVLEGITDRGLEILRAEGWTVDVHKALPPAELASRIPPYEALLGHPAGRHRHELPGGEPDLHR